MGREIIVYNQRVISLLHPEFSDGAAGKGRQMLKSGQGAGLGDKDGGVLHGAIAAQCFYGIDNSRTFLPNEHIDTVDIPAPLVDDRVDGYRASAQPFITDQQLALSLADRDERVDNLDAGIEWFMHKITRHDRGGSPFQWLHGG